MATTAKPKIGFEAGLAHELAAHLVGTHFNCAAGPLQRLLKTGYGTLVDPKGLFGVNGVLVAYQDDGGGTNVYYGRVTYRSRISAKEAARTMSDPAEVVYTQPNGDMAGAGSRSMLYAQMGSGGSMILRMLVELTDLGIPDFVAGYKAGFWDGRASA